MARLSFVVTAIAALVATAWCADPALPVKLQKNHFFKGKITYTVTASCEIADADKASYLVDAAGAFKAELGAYDTDHYPVTLTPCTGTPVQLQQVTADDTTGVLLAASLEKKLALVYYAATPTDGGDAVQTLAVVTDAATKTHVAKDAVASAQLAISGDKYIIAYVKGAVSQLVVLGGATDIDKELTAAVSLRADALHFTEGGKSYTVAFTSDLFTDATKTLADCSEKTEDQTVTIDDSMKQAYEDIAKEFTGKIEPAGAVEVCPVKLSNSGYFVVDKVSCASADVVADTEGKRYSAVCADAEAKAYAMYQLAVVVPESATGVSGSTGSFMTTLGAVTPVVVVAGAATPTFFVTEAAEGKIHVATGAFAFAAQELVAPEITSTAEIKGEGEATDISTLVAVDGITADMVGVEDGVYYAIKDEQDATAVCDRSARKYTVYTLGKEQEPKEVKICADAVLEKHHDKFIAVNVSTDPKKVEVIEVPITGDAKVIGTVTDYELSAGMIPFMMSIDTTQQFVVAMGGMTNDEHTYFIFNYKGNFMNSVKGELLMGVSAEQYVLNVKTGGKTVTYFLKTTDDIFTKKGAQFDAAKYTAIEEEYGDAVSTLTEYLISATDKKVLATAFKVDGLKSKPKGVSYTKLEGSKVDEGAEIVSETKGEETLYHALGTSIDGANFKYNLIEFSLNFEQLKAATAPTDVDVSAVYDVCRMTYKQGDKTFYQPCASSKSGGDGLSAGAIAGIVIAVVVVVVAVVLVLYFLVFKKK